MRVCLLASGSRGNTALVEADGCRLLIDAGLSAREADRRLATLGLSGNDIHAILVSHEHHDHVCGIGPLARRYGLPVYIDSETVNHLPKLGTIDDLRLFSAGDRFAFRDLTIDSFATAHDAVNPVGFAIDSSEGRVGFATDLGVATRLVAERLKSCRVLVLEANHDEQMLLAGPYPWKLKQRIRSRLGHLSNVDAVRLLSEICWEGLEAVFVAHLSAENNCPDLAASLIETALTEQGLCRPRIVVGQQAYASSCFIGRPLPETA
ncbi:MAG: MBL fold metallo-hydrolase [Desulfuromonas sp.]|nr:MAG: MBL fold metallo-hydrolase [Desulfuromonas sp.]